MIRIRDRYCHWGLTGTPERLALLREIEDRYDNGDEDTKKRMQCMAERWPDELADKHGISVDADTAGDYPVEILANCDDSELEEILNGLKPKVYYEVYWRCRYYDKDHNEIDNMLGTLVGRSEDYMKAVEMARQSMLDNIANGKYRQGLVYFEPSEMLDHDTLRHYDHMEYAPCVEKVVSHDDKPQETEPLCHIRISTIVVSDVG